MKARLSDGSEVVYWYAWRGKGAPRLLGEPGSPEFMAAYYEAIRNRYAEPDGSFAKLAQDYRASPAHQNLRESTRREEARQLDAVVDHWGSAPIAAFDDRRMRPKVREWHHSMSASPRKADLLLGTLRKVLDFARNDGLIGLNPAAGHKQLHKADRSHKIWADEQIEALCAVASPEFRRVILMAAFAGLARSDLCALTWSAVGPNSIQIRRQKTRGLATIPLYDELRAVVEEIPRGDSPHVLLSSRGAPWRPDSLSQALERTKAKAGITDDLTLHDLRGTLVTRLFALGLSDEEVAEIAGWEMRDIRQIKRVYVSREVVASAMIERLRRTK